MIHLQTHSHYSLLCGACSPAELVARAAKLEFPALALTDLNAMHGTVEFQKECDKAGLRAIHGVELTDDRPTDADPGRLVPGPLTPGRPRAVLLARNQSGYAAICRLTTLRQVRPDFSLLRELPGFLTTEGGNIFCLTDSTAVLEAIRRSATDDGGQDPVTYSRGSLRVLLPTAGGRLGPLYRRLRELAGWASTQRVPVIAGGDVYAAVPEDLERQHLLSAIRTLGTIETVGPESGSESCAPAGSWLRPAAKMHELLAEFPTACLESEAVAEQCRFQHELGQWRYPQFPLPDGETTESTLWKLCFDGLQKRYRQVTGQAMARLQEEIAVVEKLGFAGYFLIVWDIVRFAGDHGMPTLGRGSAANSLISYLLGITHVDPLKHDLYFQRFLNPERLSPPDIDLDFGWKDRDQVLEYVYDRYGRDHTTMICNINRFSTRSGFREAAKARGYGDKELSKITRRLPWRILEDPDTENALARKPEAAGLPLSREPYRSLLLQARELDRRPRHLGIHAGGVVIAGRPLTDLFPLQWARKGILISQLDMYSIEDLGLVKIDLLAQRGIAVVADAARAAGENNGISVDLSKIPDDDPGARRLMSSGDTMGCFYVESPGMRALLKKLKADTFPMVTAASSVIRPGPSDSGMSRSFVLRHLGKEAPTLPHPALEFLHETYGVMIYQEDVMRTLHAVGGLSLAEADVMRRGMSFKGDPGKFLAMKDRFLTGARKMIESGRTPVVKQEVLEELWRQLSSFAGYAFCKAHSASYAVLSFQAAWLKAHYPAEFMAAVMSNGGGFYSVSAYLEETRRLGMEILLPDINHSADVFTGRERQVRIGLQQIHNMSCRSTNALLDERGASGFFVSLGDLLQRVPQLAVNEVENLIRCGACDGFELTRPELLWRHALIRKERQGSRRGGGRGERRGDRQKRLATGSSHAPVQTATLFPVGGTAPGGGTAVSLIPAIPDYSQTEKLQQEMEVLHLTASGHPMAMLRDWLHQKGVVRAVDLSGWAGRRVKVAGKLITAKSATVRTSGQPMKFITLEDETDLVEVTLFPEVYARYGARLLGRGPYLVTGIVEDDHGSITVTAEILEMI
ncbi:MAG: DNA polymerase III subunit alpha [Gemmatimonadales bacterium]|nr:DNA polymerase III subunit alpha [Gemmatimonadales bacterium]